MNRFLILAGVTFAFSAPVLSLGETQHDHSHDAKTSKKSVHPDEHEKHGKHDDHDDDHDRPKKKKDHKEHDDHNKHGDHDDHDEHEGAMSTVGPDKAVVSVEKEGGRFKLSSESETFLGIKTNPMQLDADKNVIIPANSLVEYQDQQGIFIKDQGFFELIPVEVRKRSNGSISIFSPSLQANQKLVVSGLGSLRAAHLQLTGQGGQGHAH